MCAAWSEECRKCGNMVYGRVIGRNSPFLIEGERPEFFCPRCYPEEWDMLVDRLEAKGLTLERYPQEW